MALRYGTRLQIVVETFSVGILGRMSDFFQRTDFTAMVVALNAIEHPCESRASAGLEGKGSLSFEEHEEAEFPICGWSPQACNVA